MSTVVQLNLAVGPASATTIALHSTLSSRSTQTAFAAIVVRVSMKSVEDVTAH